MSRVYEALRRSEPEKMFLFSQPETAPSTVPSPSPDVADWNSVPTVIPALRADSRFAMLRNPGSIGAEKFRTLATRLRHLQADVPIKKLLVTSAGAQDGKSLTSANLSFALASVPRQRVLLIEGDLRKPAVMHIFGLPVCPGIVEFLQSDQHISRFTCRLHKPELYILPAGEKTTTPLSCLQSSKLDDCLRELTSWFTWVVIDSPPLLPIADANIWARRADAILLVVREGLTSKEGLKTAVASLDNNNIVAAVLNDCSRATRNYEYHY